MSNNKQAATVSFPVFSILGLIFITLKLTGHITWSWLWVLSPFWMPFVLTMGTICVILLFVAFIGVLSILLERK